MRKPYLAGNWKMNLDRAGAVQLATELRDHLGAPGSRAAKSPTAISSPDAPMSTSACSQVPTRATE